MLLELTFQTENQIGVEIEMLLKNKISLKFQPENVVCTQRENATVKIIDFGTAMELEPGEQVTDHNWDF